MPSLSLGIGLGDAKEAFVTEYEQLKRDIETLQESMRLDWEDLAKGGLSAESRAGIYRHIEWCIEEYTNLLKRLDQVPAEQS
jgi:hypothetical protein